MPAVLKMQINKSDRNDAIGIARIMQTGWFKEVHVKDIDSHTGRRRTRAAWRVWPRPGNALNGAAGDVARYNLERNVLAWLAEAARG